MNLNPTLLAGPARTDPAAHKHAQAMPAWPRHGAAQVRLPPSARRLTCGTRATERQTGEEKETAAQLVAGGSSGEVSGATTFTLPVRI